MKKILRVVLPFIALYLLLVAWSSTGHSKIGSCAALSYNQQMSQFNSWTTFISEHSSDADLRKDTDPNEAPRHYIDIDNYSEFISSGRIPSTLDSVIAVHGTSFVYDNGILPWATMATFDSLKSCFQRYDFDKAQIYAADLSHYVGDAHMPLHISANYNGQLTGNDGIHSRYESNMISLHISEIIYSGDSIHVISDVNKYIFNYLYSNFVYIDSVIEADNYAKSINSNTYSSQYKQALWEKSKSFTVPLFKNASHALAELMYTAWIQAGGPLLSCDDKEIDHADYIEQIGTNPFTNHTKFKCFLNENSQAYLYVIDISGKTVASLMSGYKTKGSYGFDWSAGNLANGCYFVVFNTEKYNLVKKIILVK